MGDTLRRYCDVCEIVGVNFHAGNTTSRGPHTARGTGNWAVVGSGAFVV